MNEASLAMFCVVAFVAIATPGPTMLLALGNGTRHGVRPALYGMAGAMTSDLLLTGAAALGLGALLAASEVAFGVVKWVGVVYLAWLGWQLLRSRGDFAGVPAAVAGERPVPARQLYLRAFLVAATNPKGYLFVSALMPQFVDPAAPQWPQWLALALLFCGIDFVVMLGYATAGARAVRLLRARGTLWLDRASGATMIAMAGSLALYRRSGP